MSDTNAVSTVLSRDGHTVDCATLGLKAQMALMSRGWSHLLGNEVASALSTWKTANPDATDAAIESKHKELIGAKVASLVDGTIGSHKGTPRGTAIETVMRKIAEDEVKAILAANGATMPTGDKTVRLGAVEFTRVQLIDRRLANEKEGPRIKRLAETEMKRRAAIANSAKPVDGEAKSAEALGL